jgi:hypothetical protein
MTTITENACNVGYMVSHDNVIPEQEEAIQDISEIAINTSIVKNSKLCITLSVGVIISKLKEELT